MNRRTCFGLAIALVALAACSGQAQTKPPASKPQGRTTPAPDPRPAEIQQAIEKKDFNLAAILLSDYLKDHPNDADMHFQLGFAYSSLNRASDALVEYRRAIELNPALVPAQLNLGLTLLDLNDYAGAAKAFERSADLVPDQARPHFLAGEALARGNDVAAAIAQYELAASLDAKDFDIFFRWGVALLRVNKPADAEQRLRQAVGLRPESGPAHLALANSLLDQKKSDAAIAELTKYVQDHPGDLQASTDLASALFAAGKPAEAVAELNRGDADRGTTLERAKLRASIQISQQQWDAAIQTLSAAVRFAPQDSALRAELGRIYLQKRDFPNAERELRRSLEIDGTQLPTLKDLATTLYLAGNYEAALEVYDRIALREPPTAFVFFLRATCYDNLNRRMEAVAAYQKFMELDQGKTDKEEFQARERIKVLLRELANKK
jgi:tetratricopeptide (TPR) repeat protein